MLNVSDALKQIYRRNMLPLSTVKADIQGKISFGDLGVTVGNDRIVKDTFRLTEMISDGGDLDFGSTNASVVEFTVADVPEDLNGQRFTITQTVNGTYTVSLGTFTVDSCKRQDDLRFKDIVAYDDMQKFNRNVADWYNGLTFPITVKGMRESLCQYCGVAYESVTLVNDNVRVYKTLDTNELNGKEVLRAIAEVNGTFAHINRYAKLTFIGLDSFALYPSETLYPADDLFPEDVTEILEKQGENAIAYISSKYEDYTVSAIDGVIVRDDENASVGIKVGESTNPYYLDSNILILGKEQEELTTIASNLLTKIGQVVYTPHDTESIGLPYVEVGDTVLNANSADKELFIAKRVLTGVSSVMDNFSAGGNQKRENHDSIDSTEIRKIKGLTTKIIKEVGRVGVEIENFETETKTQFMVMDGQITAEISRAQSAEASLQVSVNGLRTEVRGKVDDEEVRSIFAVEIGKIKLSSKQIELEGYVTANKGFAIDEEGTAILSDLSGNIAEMSGGGLYIRNSDESQRCTYSYNGALALYGGVTYRLFRVGVNGITIGDANRYIANGYFNNINGGTPITTANMGQYLPTSTNQITPSLTEYGNIDFNGSVNGASVTYVQENFARLSALQALEARVSALES